MSSNSSVFFSLIVPVFKKDKHIEHTLSSILNQNFKNYEIIIVDDGSYDNTENILKKYKDNKNTIVLTYKKMNLYKYLGWSEW